MQHPHAQENMSVVLGIVVVVILIALTWNAHGSTTDIYSIIDR